MTRPQTRAPWCACLFLLAACGGDSPAPTANVDAGAQQAPADDSDTAPDASTTDPEATPESTTDAATTDPGAVADAEASDALEQAVSHAVGIYVEQIEATCPCFVETGAYASIDECRKYTQAADHWVPCATEVLRPSDSPEVRESLTCLEEIAQSNLACFEETSCGSSERAACTETLLFCFGLQPELILELDTACPDFSLIPRQNPLPDDTAGSVPDPGLVGVVENLVASLDQTAQTTCPCQTESGGYASVEECLQYNQPDEQAAACMAGALAPFDTPQLREDLTCMVELGNTGRTCFADHACGSPEQRDCIGSPLDCFEEPPTFFLALSEMCADLMVF